VQNPTLNGVSLFTATTLNTSDLTLHWSAPALGSPYGYTVKVLTPVTLTLTPVSGSPGGGAAYIPPPGGTTPQTITIYLPVATLSTAQTSLRLPPGVVAQGKTYLFMITALADARANMETSPNRSALPSASANMISAPITITSVTPQT
jgi:hypothetical protein